MSDTFTEQIADYRNLIDADIRVYSEHIRKTSRKQYGEQGYLVTNAFLDLLGRGGKRMRGALVMAGYEMCGGTDRNMIVRAATALEMIHAYILIVDDIQDRSSTRRGKPTVHKMLAQYHHDQALSGDTEHIGTSLALNAALMGGSAAHMLFAGLVVDAELKNKVIGIVNHTIMVTIYGQTYDIMNEITPDVTIDDIRRTMELKTANYSILNPLCVGMVLAGADCEDTDAIRNYALQAGMAFQITDDILGVFGTDAQTGKSALDDIREGKQTFLTVHAKAHASQDEVALLRQSLGNDTLTQKDFEACKGIFQGSGALAFAQDEAQRHTKQAIEALAQPRHNWQKKQVEFLRQLAGSLEARKQ